MALHMEMAKIVIIFESAEVNDAYTFIEYLENITRKLSSNVLFH